MANLPLSSLPLAISLDGSEEVPVVQGGTTKRTTTGTIAGLANIGSGGLGAFVTAVNQSSIFPNSRRLAAGSGVTLTDGGAGSALTINVTASGIPFTPAGDITQTNVQSAIQQVDTLAINRTLALTGTAVGTLAGSILNVSDDVVVTGSSTDQFGNFTPEGWDNVVSQTFNWTSGSAGTATGSRAPLLANLFFKHASSPSNPSPFYAAAIHTANIYTDDNGIAGTPKGLAYGLATVSYLKSTVKHWSAIFGYEGDITVEAGASVDYKIGTASFLSNNDAVQGNVIDAAFYATALTASPGWRNVFLVNNQDGTNPMSADGTLLGTKGAVPMTNVIDVTSATVSGYLYKSGPLKITGAGLMTLSANAAGTVLPAGAITGSLVGRFVGPDASPARIVLDSFGTGTATAFSGNNMRRANGTLASPSGVKSGDLLCGYVGTGYGTTGFLDSGGGGFSIWASQDGTDAHGGTEIAFNVTPNNAVNNIEAGRAINSGALNWHFPVTVLDATAIPAGGTAGAGLKFSSTANFGTFFGSGVPTLSAAKGSLYLRSDGSSTSTRMYVNTDGGTTWTNVVTAA